MNNVLNVNPRDTFDSLRKAAVHGYSGPWVRTEPCHGFAQLTARCSQNNQHAYVLHLDLAGGLVRRIRYARGSAKVQSQSAAPEVETAMALFCRFAEGRLARVVLEANLDDLAQECAPENGEEAGRPQSFPVTPDELLALRLRFQEPLSSLYLGGAIPFILFRWALLNLEIKQAVYRVMNTPDSAPVRLDSVESLNALMRELSANPALSRRIRGLELGVRSLNRHTVDESILRSGYQRETYADLLALAARRGFAGQFEASH
ncbi:MAG: hypothetical protein WED00_03550 [Aquisalimonadaceae bacterium]